MMKTLGSKARSRRAMLKVILRWAFYVTLLILFYLFSCNSLIKAFAPLLLIPLATAVAMHEGDLAAGIFGMFCGLMMDMANGNSIMGFYALWLLCACPCISLLSRFLIKVNFVSHLVINAAVSAVMALMDMLFLHWVWEGSQSAISFVRVILPSYGGAILFSIPVYFLITLIVSKLCPNERRRLESSAQSAEDAENSGNERD